MIHTEKHILHCNSLQIYVHILMKWKQVNETVFIIVMHMYSLIFLFISRLLRNMVWFHDLLIEQKPQATSKCLETHLCLPSECAPPMSSLLFSPISMRGVHRFLLFGSKGDFRVGSRLNGFTLGYNDRHHDTCYEICQVSLRGNATIFSAAQCALWTISPIHCCVDPTWTPWHIVPFSDCGPTILMLSQRCAWDKVG